MAQAPKSIAEISTELQLFSVRTFSVLVDDATDSAMIESIPRTGVDGFYSFTAAMAGSKKRDRKVQLLPTMAHMPDSQAWLVATRSKAGYALNEFLRQHEDKFVFTLARDRVSAMYSYVDFFHGETETIAYVTNNFERGYKIHFPIAVRFLLRSQTGEVLRAWQRLIAPNQTIAIDSREMDLTEPLFGYLELYTDIRHVNGEVSPFLHFNCDYISADGIAAIHRPVSNHGPPARVSNAVLSPSTAITSLQFRCSTSRMKRPSLVAQCCASRETANDVPSNVTCRRSRDHMVLVNINELFDDELAHGAEAVDVIITPDKPMHRPNFYLHPRGHRWSWTAVEHSAQTTALVLPLEQRNRLADVGVRPWICAFPILARKFEIDTSVIYFQEGDASLHDFTFDVHDQTGKKRHTEDVHCGFGQRINVSDWMHARSLSLDGGLLIISASAKAPQVPHSFGFLLGFQSQKNPYFSMTVSGGSMLNIPFEWERHWMWNHPMVPTVHTEQFGKAVVNNEFDTIVTLNNASAVSDYDRVAEIEFDVYAPDGKMAHFHKTIAPNSSIAFSIGELLQGSGLVKQGYYAVWMYCRSQQIQGFHILQRKNDRAIGAQHFYYCRFNALESDLPLQPRTEVSHDPEIVQSQERVSGLARFTRATRAMMNRGISEF